MCLIYNGKKKKTPQKAKNRKLCKQGKMKVLF